jgi:hypothetical protein
MALVLKDRVKETTITIGTSTLVLLGAASGFQSFSVIGDGNTTYYTIDGGTEWEVGIGTYTLLGTTLSRDTILESSNGGTAVNFSAGTKNVFVTYPAERALYTDASSNAIGLGTPASATLTNATGLPLTTGVTGTLPVANGGTGVTNSTGTGNTVLSASPTFTGTVVAPTINAGAATALTLQSASTTAITIDTSQNVGIGTTSPFAKFHSSVADGPFQGAFSGTTKAVRFQANSTAMKIEGVDNTLIASFQPLAFGGSLFTFETSGTERMRIDSSGNLLFNSGYGSVATAYGCRAWVNFNGTANSNLTGTYSRTGTTVTVTATNHGLIVGNSVNLDFTSGTAADGIFTVVTVADANTFTITHGTSGSTSGNVTLLRNTIRASGNVTSITDNGTGDYTINFTSSMPDVNYSAVTSGQISAANTGRNYIGSTEIINSSSVRIRTVAGDGAFYDYFQVFCSVFR